MLGRINEVLMATMGQECGCNGEIAAEGTRFIGPCSRDEAIYASSGRT
jgi:hypothetical protein